MKENKNKKGTFITIPTRILKSNLHPNSKLLYGLILSYSRNGKDCFESNDTLGAHFNVVGRTVSKYVSELKKHGLIWVKSSDGRKRYLNLVKQNSKAVLDYNQPDQITTASTELNFDAIDSSYRDLIIEFVEYRMQNRKPIHSQKTLEAFLKKLDGLVFRSKCNYPQLSNNEIRIKIIQQAIGGGYPTIVELLPPRNNRGNYPIRRDGYTADALKQTNRKKGATTAQDSIKQYMNNLNELRNNHEDREAK